jgi:hypothetical protein
VSSIVFKTVLATLGGGGVVDLEDPVAVDGVGEQAAVRVGEHEKVEQRQELLHMEQVNLLSGTGHFFTGRQEEAA